MIKAQQTDSLHVEHILTSCQVGSSKETKKSKKGERLARE
jgi:hypothetical protein